MNPRVNTYSGVSICRICRKASILLVLLAAAPLAWAEREVSETRAVAGNAHITVENKVGDILVEGWDRDEVRINGWLNDDVQELEIDETSNGLRVRVLYRDKRHVDSVDLELTIPSGASLEAETVSGDIESSDVNGSFVELRSVSGDLDVEGNPERVSMASVSGDVEFDGESSRVSIESVSGEVTLNGVGGEVEATTVSGDVYVEGTVLERGEFEAVSGDVELDFAVKDGGRINVSNMSGDIEIYLPDDQKAEFYAQSFSGDVASDFGTVSRVDRGPGSSLQHREGNNGASIHLNSFSGDVTINRK